VTSSRRFELGKGKDDPFDDSLEGHHRRRIFICTFSILARFTQCDGELKKEERKEIGRICREVLELDDKRTHYAAQVFKDALKNPTKLTAWLKEFKELLVDQPKMLPWLLDILNKVALADGNCSVEERRFIRGVADFYGISDSVRESSKASFNPGSERYKAILGLGPEAGWDEVSKKYQELRNEYDPERIKEKGMPKEFIALATEKLSVIEGAYLILEKEMKG
jgi:DnaJ like chaperone protein